MKKTLMRILSVFLALVLIVGIVPMSTFAQNNNIADAEESFGSQNALDIIANQIVEGQQSEDYVVSYVEVKNKTATVDFSNAEPCLLIAAIYDENSLQMLAYGMIEVGTEHLEVKVDINIDVMPEHFITKAFLVNKEYAPLSNEYVSYLNTTKYEQFLKKEPDDFKSESVIIFDDQKETEDFAVLVDNANSLEYDSKISFAYDEDTYSFKFENSSDEIKNLSVGDICYYPFGECSNEFLLFKVKSIKVNDDVVTIVEDEDIFLEDFFEFVRVDTEADGSKIDKDEIVYGEALEPISKGEEELLRTAAESDPEFDYDTGNKSFSMPFSINWKIFSNGTNGKDEPDNTTVEASISASAGYSFTSSARLIYDVKLFGKDYYEFNSTTTHNFYLAKVNVSGKFKLPETLDLLNKLGLLIPKIPLGPFTLSIKPRFILEFGASITLDLINYEIKKVITADRDNGRKETKVETAEFKNPKLDEGIEIKIAINISFNLTFAGVEETKWKDRIGLTLSGEVGIVYKGAIDSFRAWTDTHHDCILCIKGPVKAYLNIKLTLKLKIVEKVLDFSWNAIDWTPLEKELFKFYISINPNGISCGKGECHNRSHKVTVSVMIGEEGVEYEYVEGAWVSVVTGVCDSNKDGKYEEKEMITNSKGEAVFYFKPGEHSVTASYEGYGNLTQNFRIIENDTKKVTIKLTKEKDPDNPDNPDNPNNPNNPGVVSHSLSGTTLTISGSGNMTNFTNYISGQPWASLRQTVTKIVVEPGVTSIGDNAFYQFVNLESVSIPNTVTYIGDGAFYECNSLKKIELPNSVETIADYAFYGCKSLGTADLGSSVKTIGAEAFCLCSGLSKIVIPASCTNVGDKAFDLCYNLGRIDFENKDCVIYDSASTIYSAASIYGYSDSSAYKYAKKYNRTFKQAMFYTQSVIDTTEVYDSYSITYSACVAAEDYILLNVTSYGAGFELTTSNLEYIDQLTADASGKVSCNFIPRNSVSGSTTLLIGDFGNGTETKIVTPRISSTSVEIVNNPGVLTINYMEGIRLYADIISPIDGCTIQWYVNDAAYTISDTIEIQHISDETKITVKLVDANGNPVLKNGEEIISEETIKVNSGFFQKLVAFFKFTLFRQVVLKTN